MYTGIKYHAITHDKMHDKWPYDPEPRGPRSGRAARQPFPRQPREAGRGPGGPHGHRPPILVAPYDAELFGHWWFEGPLFINDVLRQIHFDQKTVETITPGDYLDRHPTNQVATPSLSSWGAKGYGSYWCNETNAWTWRHVHVAGERMVELARTHPDAQGVQQRALNQAARELMLAQSSDWPFIMTTGSTVPYATRRFNEHTVRFTRLYDELRAGRVDESHLADLESKDNIFPHVDYRIFAT